MRSTAAGELVERDALPLCVTGVGNKLVCRSRTVEGRAAILRGAVDVSGCVQYDSGHRGLTVRTQPVRAEIVDDLVGIRRGAVRCDHGRCRKRNSERKSQASQAMN